MHLATYIQNITGKMLFFVSLVVCLLTPSLIKGELFRYFCLSVIIFQTIGRHFRLIIWKVKYGNGLG